MSQTITPTNSPLNQRRVWIFRLVAFIIPVLFILLLESVLRLTWETENLDLFITDPFNPQYYVVNQVAGKRYFQGSGFGSFGTQDAFRKVKPDSTLRIFVLGGSSTAGYPYQYSGTFPAMLKTRLQEAYPEFELEVVNLGMTAVMSYTVRDFALECLNYDPDLLVIYAGHNEFYGALGSGSSQHAFIRTNRLFTRFFLKLKSIRLYQFMQFLLQSISNDSNAGDNRTLMARMAQNQAIPYNSRLYKNTLSIFRENMEDIIEETSGKGIPVLLGTLVSNLRDQKPFVSIHDPDTDKASFTAQIEDIKNRMRDGDYSTALEKLRSLMVRDSTYALTYFYAGRCAELSGEYATARTYYRQARDYDGLRFRASGDLNSILRKLAQKDLVYLSDIEAAFIENSNNGLIGNNLILEHLHPNLDGYFLMGKTYAQTILQTDLLSIARHRALPKPIRSKSDDYFRSRIAVTDLDLKIADYRIRMLTSGWPFKKHQRFITVDDLKPETVVEKLAVDVLKKTSNYEKAHVSLAKYYSQNGDPERAIKEYYTLATTFPTNESPFMALGRLLIKQRRFDEALPILEKTLTMTKDPFSTKWLGTIYLNQGEVKLALPYLQSATILNPKDGQTLYNLSGAYFLSGDTLQAIRTVESLLKMYPDFPDAQAFHAQLKAVLKHPRQ